MAVPIAVWIAAGLGAAGIKIYMDRRDVSQIVENSQARYEEEKYNYYQVQQSLMPLLMFNGRLKLEIWESFKRLVMVLEQIENLPRQVKYMTFTPFRVGKPERNALKENAKIVENILARGIAEMGTGILTGLALYGGTLTQKMEQCEINKFPGFPECEEGTSILEALSTHKIDIPPAGNVAEAAVLNAILDIPAVVQDFGVAALDKKDKKAAIALKDNIDQHSIELADVVGKMQRVQLTLERITGYMNKLFKEYKKEIPKLEELVKTKKDYEQYTSEEKTLLVYTAFLVNVLKGITRIDILLKRGNLYVLNTLDIRDCTEVTKKLFPDEEI
ncbi:MAG TPA: hypothetical protein IAB06_07850 [Candidatus Avacidaminococcus intestinavium]|uniref:Uncharacterized protein n=1 Tax=Candidatus Avacidaminococcus intestinavium TaxID=2840684 RepID=A0A9D1SMC1_9FIRM|nr:hypothetical protein [Candidatus Avacidaminococcus intestinavium]